MTQCSTCNQTLPTPPKYGAIDVVCTSYSQDSCDFVGYGNSRISVRTYRNVDHLVLYNLGSQNVPLVVVAKSEWEKSEADLIHARETSETLRRRNTELSRRLDDIHRAAKL